jgi:hypothetical protein
LGACVIAGSPGLCHAKNNCPWINEATASGLLSGEATGEMTEAAPGQPAVCTFTQQDKGVTRILKITVEQSANPHPLLVSLQARCGANGMALSAIGNEAMMCAVDDRKGAQEELVAGRVRDQVFTISMRTTMKNDPLFNKESLQPVMRLAAEQVSGNLF